MEIERKSLLSVLIINLNLSILIIWDRFETLTSVSKMLGIFYLNFEKWEDSVNSQFLSYMSKR